MEIKTYQSLLKFKEILKKHPSFVGLLRLEKEMEEDEEVQLLAYKKDLANSDYNDILKIYKEDDLEARKVREKLYLAKKNLEEHPKVRKYLEKYSEVRNILKEVNHILFDDFVTNLCPKKD